MWKTRTYNFKLDYYFKGSDCGADLLGGVDVVASQPLHRSLDVVHKGARGRNGELLAAEHSQHADRLHSKK